MRHLPPYRRAAVLALLLLANLTAPSLAAQVREDEMAVGPNIEKEDYFRAGIAPVRAPAGYDLTIVYFMDYQCPSCRRYTPDVARALGEDKRIRMIYRDTPILSDLSTVAARAAIAASFQGRHAAFHHALMMTKGQLTEAAIRAAADTAKVDWARLQRDLKARGEDIDLQIARNFELATATGVQGTPAFIIGDRQSNGALDYASLKAEIADARAEARAKGAPVAAAAPAPAKAAPTTGADTAQAEPAAEVTAPIFRQADLPEPRPAAAGEQRDAGRSTIIAWLAAVAVLAAAAAGAGLVRRRRRAAPA